MDANERVINRLKRLYSLYGASDQVNAVVSMGGHAYRPDIRQAAFRFFNTQFKNDPRPITDSEIDLVSEGDKPGPYPIPPEKLRVFPRDDDLPADANNRIIDESFVPMAQVAPPEAGTLVEWQKALLAELRRVTFRYFPDEIPAAKRLGGTDKQTVRMQSEQSIEFRLRYGSAGESKKSASLLLVVLNQDEAGTTPAWIADVATPDQTVIYCEPRGIGETRWTEKDPPNYVKRCHALLGRTVDTGRVWDVIAAANYLAASSSGNSAADKTTVRIAGKGPASLIAAYAAIQTPEIAGVTLVAPPTTHMDSAAPQFLNILRVCDVPAALGLLAPRPLTIIGAPPERCTATSAAYTAADAKNRLHFK